MHQTHEMMRSDQLTRTDAYTCAREGWCVVLNLYARSAISLHAECARKHV